jgi:repressor LexA
MAAALKKAKSLSRRQEQILDFIETFLNRNAYPPTIREIQKELDISSTSVVDYNLNALEERGYIRRNRHISRGIELFGFSAAQPSNVVSIPVVGRIAAGEPIEVPEDYAAGEFAESVTMPISMLPKATDGLFALRVRGHSMVDALINDGDLVILKPQLTADNGDTVAVWLKSERETTLKRFYREGARVRLQPANVTMQPIYTDATNVAVQGKLVGVIRAVDNRF